MASRAALLTLLLVLGTASAAALIGRAIASPIERLTKAASRIAQGERQAVLPPPFGREVRTLTHAVESMRRELEGRHLAEKLAADLSHELKNPVAAIRAAAEVLADGALDEPETARRFVARIAEATHRLQGIVNNLLMLTRLQARGVVREPVDLAELTRALRQRGDLDVRVYPDNVNYFQDLKLGRIDAVMTDTPIARLNLAREPSLAAAGPPFAFGFYSVAVRQEDHELLRRIDPAIEELIRNGTLETIYRKYDVWGPDQRSLADWQDPQTTAR